VFLKDLRPLEEKSQGLGVLLTIDIRTVYYVDLHYQRLILLHVVLEGVRRIRLLRDLILLFSCIIGLVFQDEAGTADLLFQVFRTATDALRGTLEGR
jgi:hypothetical protein